MVQLSKLKVKIKFEPILPFHLFSILHQEVKIFNQEERFSHFDLGYLVFIIIFLT